MADEKSGGPAAPPSPPDQQPPDAPNNSTTIVAGPLRRLASVPMLARVSSLAGPKTLDKLIDMSSRSAYSFESRAECYNLSLIHI